MQPTPQTDKVVRQLTASNGVGDDRRVTYQYRDAATHVAGRGSLGFASVISTDLQTGFVTTMRYSQEWPHVGMVVLEKIGGTFFYTKFNSDGLRGATVEWKPADSVFSTRELRKAGSE